MSAGWTFSKVVKLLVRESRTGVLRVTTDRGEVLLHVDEGRLVACESGDFDDLLADSLVESETLGVNQMNRVLKRKRKRGLPIPQLLVDSNLCSPDVARRYVELVVREIVLPLFRRRDIGCRFEKGTPTPDPWLLPLPLAHLLKTAASRAKHWPTLEAQIPTERIVFDKVDEFVDTVLGSRGPTLQQPVSEGQDQHMTDEIGGHERVVYYYVNGKKTVSQLVHASGVGHYETYRALVSLAEMGVITVVAEQGRGERRKNRRVLLPALLRLVAWGIAAAVVAGLVVLRPGALKEPRGFLQVVPPGLEKAAQWQGHERAAAAVEAAFLTSGMPRSYPESLEALVDEGLLMEETVRDIEDSGVRYRATGDRDTWAWTAKEQRKDE